MRTNNPIPHRHQVEMSSVRRSKRIPKTISRYTTAGSTAAADAVTNQQSVRCSQRIPQPILRYSGLSATRTRSGNVPSSSQAAGSSAGAGAAMGAEDETDEGARAPRLTSATVAQQETASSTTSTALATAGLAARAVAGACAGTGAGADANVRNGRPQRPRNPTMKFAAFLTEINKNTEDKKDETAETLRMTSATAGSAAGATADAGWTTGAGADEILLTEEYQVIMGFLASQALASRQTVHVQAQRMVPMKKREVARVLSAPGATIDDMLKTTSENEDDDVVLSAVPVPDTHRGSSPAPPSTNNPTVGSKRPRSTDAITSDRDALRQSSSSRAPATATQLEQMLNRTSRFEGDVQALLVKVRSDVTCPKSEDRAAMVEKQVTSSARSAAGFTRSRYGVPSAARASIAQLWAAPAAGQESPSDQKACEFAQALARTLAGVVDDEGGD